MTRLSPRLLTSMLLMGTLFGVTACKNKKDDPNALDAQGAEQLPDRARHNNISRDGFDIIPADLNRDGNPDQWKLAGKGGKVLRIERDLNFDNVVDVWQYLDDVGVVIEEEMDLDHDRSVDVVVFYREDGTVEHKELAIEFKGKFTVFKYYDQAEQLLRVEQDEDADGIPDRWDYYEDKRLARTGWDENNDGVPDRFDEL